MSGSPRKVLRIIVGSVVGLIGLALLTGGGTLLWASQTQVEDDGYLTSRTQRFAAEGRAIVSESLDIVDLPGSSGRWADLRIRATGARGQPVFVGVARRDDVQRYLDGVARAELTDLDFDPFRATYRPRPGSRIPGAPTTQDFWAAEIAGTGEQTLTWDVADGNWQVVAMNPDGSPGVDLDASIGVKFSYVLAVTVVALVLGALILAGGLLLIVSGARGRRRTPGGGS